VYCTVQYKGRGLPLVGVPALVALRSVVLQDAQSILEYSTVLCSAVQYSTVQYSTLQAQYSTLQYSTDQKCDAPYSGVQYRTVRTSLMGLKRQLFPVVHD